jgi:hypothetical protein
VSLDDYGHGQVITPSPADDHQKKLISPKFVAKEFQQTEFSPKNIISSSTKTGNNSSQQTPTNAFNKPTVFPAVESTNPKSKSNGCETSYGNGRTSNNSTPISRIPSLVPNGTSPPNRGKSLFPPLSLRTLQRRPPVPAAVAFLVPMSQRFGSRNSESPMESMSLHRLRRIEQWGMVRSKWRYFKASFSQQ